MPTGYTAEIYEGKDVTGKDFILRCARAFGALIDMRDDPLDAPIKDAEVDNYHLDSLDTARNELKKYQQMTHEQAKTVIDAEYEKAIKEHDASYQRTVDMRNRYLNTLAEVTVWQPPTNEHKKLKEFAISQLKDSMNFDCNLDYYQEHKPVKLSPDKWIQSKIDSAIRDIEYHSKEYKAEQDRANQRNQWIADLTGSL